MSEIDSDDDERENEEDELENDFNAQQTEKKKEISIKTTPKKTQKSKSDDDDDVDDDDNNDNEGEEAASSSSINLHVDADKVIKPKLEHMGQTQGSGSEEQEAEEEEDDQEEIVNNFPTEGEVDGLNTSPEIKKMFKSLLQYTPNNISLTTVLKPFIPDFQPAIGDTDSFIKIPRIDGGHDNLGLTVIDEPGPEQSNPSVLEMKLKKEMKMHNLVSSSGARSSFLDDKHKETDASKQRVDRVRTVDINEKGALGLQAWIRNLEEYHKGRPSPSVNYTSGPMPALETLMQEWPPEFESELRNTVIPSLRGLSGDMPLDNYVRIILCILDIPVYAPQPTTLKKGSGSSSSSSSSSSSNIKGIKEALHVLFSLFSEFKQNPHFKLIEARELYPLIGLFPQAQNPQGK